MAGILLFPVLSFAATTTPNATLIVQLKAELAVLEAELAQILMTQAPIQATGVGIGTIQASVTSSPTYNSVSGPVYRILLTVTNGSASTIYVPTNLEYVQNTTNTGPDIAYTLIPGMGDSVYAGTGAGTAVCAPQVQLPTASGYVQACEIQAGQTSTFTLTPSFIPTSLSEGSYSLDVINLSYTTNATTANPTFEVLPIPSNTTMTLGL